MDRLRDLEAHLTFDAASTIRRAAQLADLLDAPISHSAVTECPRAWCALSLLQGKKPGVLVAFRTLCSSGRISDCAEVVRAVVEQMTAMPQPPVAGLVLLLRCCAKHVADAASTAVTAAAGTAGAAATTASAALTTTAMSLAASTLTASAQMTRIIACAAAQQLSRDPWASQLPLRLLRNGLRLGHSAGAKRSGLTLLEPLRRLLVLEVLHAYGRYLRSRKAALKAAVMATAAAGAASKKIGGKRKRAAEEEGVVLQRQEEAFSAWHFPRGADYGDAGYSDDSAEDECAADGGDTTTEAATSWGRLSEPLQECISLVSATDVAAAEFSPLPRAQTLAQLFSEALMFSASGVVSDEAPEASPESAADSADLASTACPFPHALKALIADRLRHLFASEDANASEYRWAEPSTFLSSASANRAWAHACTASDAVVAAELLEERATEPAEVLLTRLRLLRRIAGEGADTPVGQAGSGEPVSWTASSLLAAALVSEGPEEPLVSVCTQHAALALAVRSEARRRAGSACGESASHLEKLVLLSCRPEDDARTLRRRHTGLRLAWPAVRAALWARACYSRTIDGVLRSAAALQPAGWRHMRRYTPLSLDFSHGWRAVNASPIYLPSVLPLMSQKNGQRLVHRCCLHELSMPISATQLLALKSTASSKLLEGDQGPELLRACGAALLPLMYGERAVPYESMASEADLILCSASHQLMHAFFLAGPMGDRLDAPGSDTRVSCLLSRIDAWCERGVLLGPNAALRRDSLQSLMVLIEDEASDVASEFLTDMRRVIQHGQRRLFQLRLHVQGA